MATKFVTYVVEIGKEVIVLHVEEDGDNEMITVTKAGKAGYIVAVDLGFEKVAVGDWPDGEEWVEHLQYPNT